MSTIELTRRYQFSASHRLHAQQLSAEENRRIYGKCNNPLGHGHNYWLEVTVSGPVDPQTGRAISPSMLDRLVEATILRELAYSNLNEVVEHFAFQPPTTENLALVMQQRLLERWPQWFSGEIRLVRIRLEETRRNIIESEP